MTQTSTGKDWDFEYWPQVAIAGTLDTLIDL